MLEQRADAHVTAIGLSGQMHSSVFLDAGGTVIRPALLWCDGRTTQETREITDRAGGEQRLRDWVSNPALEGFTLPKVLWLRNHEPAAFARLSTVLLAKDYVRYRLTSELATEPSDASGTLMYDPAQRRWSRELMDAVSLPLSLLPNVGASHEVLGHVTADAARVSGLGAGTPVVGGGADNACGAVGVGAITPGDAVARGSEGVTFLPYLQGERTPHRDASARGAFIGLSLAHARAHLTRAVLEGVCFALRDSLAILQELGLAPEYLLLTGGGARSPFVRQMQAEVCGLPVRTVNREEGPAYGAALLAAVGAGVFRDLNEASRTTLERAPLEVPDREAHVEYEPAYARFRAAYRAARPRA